MKLTRFNFFLAILLFSACNQSESEQTVSTDQIEKDTFYLISRATGDTIPTGVPFKVEGEWKDTANYQTFKNQAVSYTEEKKARIITNFDASISSRRRVYWDSLETITYGVDTFPAPEIVPSSPEVVWLKASASRKISPMRHKENARMDVQYIDADLGLNSSYINVVITTSDGMLWFGTPKGLTKFDGQFVTDYSSENGLPDDFVQVLFEDSKNNLWIGTQYGGVAKYDGKKLHIISKKNGLAANNIAAINEDSAGNIWIGMWGGGVDKFDGKTITHLNRKNGLFELRVTNLIVDDNDKVWITTNGGGLFNYDGLTLNHFWAKAGYGDSYLTSILIDSKERIWMGNWYGITYLQGDSVFRIPAPPKALNFPNSTIFEDSKKNIWIPSFQYGLVKYDDKSIHYFNEETGLTNNSISSICEDPAGNIWFGTQGGGLCRYNPNSFNYFGEADGMRSSSVNAYGQLADGRIVFGTDAGVTIFDDSTFNNIRFADRLYELSGFIGDVLIDRDSNIWVSVFNCCVYKLGKDGIRRYAYNEGLVDHNIKTIAQRGNGEIWFGSVGVGLGRFNENGFTTFNARSGLNNSFIEDLIVDKNDNLWIATDGEGITKYDGNEFIHLTTNEGLVNNQVNAIFEDCFGQLWIATKKGISLFRDSVFVPFPANFSLPDKNVAAIIQDAENNYWITTANGILFLQVKSNDGIKKWNPENYTQKYFSISDGLMGMDFIPRSAFVDSKNRVWLGGGRGLIMKDLSRFDIKPVAPEIILSTVKINGQFIDYNQLSNSTYTKNLVDGDLILGSVDEVKKFTNYSASLKLPHDLNHLTFVFSGKNWHSDKMQFSYMLEGFDETWSTPNQETWAEYRNLTYGNYIFKVKAIGEGAVESEIVYYEFQIFPPWWHTWWARLVYLLILVLLLRWFIKWRTKKLHEKQAQLERAVEDRTQQLNVKNAELQQQYSVIEEQKLEVEKSKIEIEHQHTLLEETHKEIRDSINYAKRIQEAILPNDNLVNELLPDNFIYYQPKDIVAGDFYWIHQLEKGVLFAAADCTGHGVPGAMVSVVCNNALNRAVKEFALKSPDEILNKTRDLVIETFDKKGARVNDGMDIGLCWIDAKSKKLSFSGANNGLIIIRNNELLELAGDKQPIGKYDKPTPFSLKEEKLQKDDLVYLFTDGFADQFGGPKGKKFKSKALKDLLLELASLPMQEQKKKLSNTLEQWKGDLEQVDDISLFGFRI